MLTTITIPKKHYYDYTIYTVNVQWVTSNDYNELLHKLKNHWIQCGGTINRHDILIGDENTLTEFYLTFDSSPKWNITFNDITPIWF